MRQLWQIVPIGLIVAGSMASLAFGDECSAPVRVITLVPNERGRILLAFELDDKPASFMLDTGAFWGWHGSDRHGEKS